MRERKEFELELKKSDPASGSFEGLASVYGNVDLQGDRVMPGAFTKTLAERSEIPLLWQHDMHQPIGLVRLTDSSRGLAANGLIDIDIPEGKRAHSALTKGYVKGLSIGYDVVGYRYAKDGVRELTDVKLWELSVVTFPANPLATVTAAKEEADAVGRALGKLLHDVRAVKEGRVLSGQNLAHLKMAIGHLDTIAVVHSQALDHLRAIHDAATAPAGDPDPDDPMDDPVTKALQRLRRNVLVAASGCR